MNSELSNTEIESKMDEVSNFSISELQDEVSDLEFWEGLPSSPDPDEKQPVELIRAKALVDYEYPETTWLVRDLIPSIGFTAITGAPYTYKSFITEHLAICVATGKPLFNHFEVTQGAVLMVDKENSPNLIKDRLLKLGFLGDPEIYFLSEPDRYSLEDDATLSKTIDLVKELKIKLIVLDSFAHIHKGEENDSGAVVRTFEKLKRLTNLGCAVVFIHHHRKPTKFAVGTVLDMIRGSSDIGAELEAHIALDPLKERIRVTQGKNRWGQLLPPFTITPAIGEVAAIFEYSGHISEEISKSEEAEQMILNTLVRAPEVSRQAFLDLFTGAVSPRTIVEKLKALEESGTIMGTMRGKSKYFTLTEKGRMQQQMQFASIDQEDPI